MVEKLRSFEEMVRELESILQTLEQGDQPLDEMIKLYQRGVDLAAQCRVRIDAAEDLLAQDSKRINGEEKCN